MITKVMIFCLKSKRLAPFLSFLRCKRLPYSQINEEPTLLLRCLAHRVTIARETQTAIELIRGAKSST